MRKSLVVLIAVIIAAMLCGCADDVSSVQQEDSSSRSSTKWTVTKVADDDISCEGLVLTALNSGDFPEMVKATDSTLLDTIMDFSKYGITDYCVYQQAREPFPGPAADPREKAILSNTPLRPTARPGGVPNRQTNDPAAGKRRVDRSFHT